MTISEFISNLYDLDVKLWYEGDRLRVAAPDGVLTADLQAELVSRKSEVLIFLKTVDTTNQVIAPTLQPISRDGDLGLSFAQQRLWYLDQFEPGNAAYHIPTVVRIEGKLNKVALERSLSEIVRRHESLRTTFPNKAGQPFQRISRPGQFNLSVVDLRDVPSGEREAEAHRITTEEAERPFDLAKGPLFRSTLLQMGDSEYALLLTMHHIVSDGWSMRVLTRELQTLYLAFSQGKPSPLSELPIHYADFAHWQRVWLQEKAVEVQLAYWKKQLGGELPVLELPTDYPRPGTQTYRGSRQC